MDRGLGTQLQLTNLKQPNDSVTQGTPHTWTQKLTAGDEEEGELRQTTYPYIGRRNNSRRLTCMPHTCNQPVTQRITFLICNSSIHCNAVAIAIISTVYTDKCIDVLLLTETCKAGILKAIFNQYLQNLYVPAFFPQYRNRLTLKETARVVLLVTVL